MECQQAILADFGRPSVANRQGQGGQLPNVEPVESLSRESVEAGGQVWQILSLEAKLEAVGAGGQVSYIWLGKRANPLHFDTLIHF